MDTIGRGLERRDYSILPHSLELVNNIRRDCSADTLKLFRNSIKVYVLCESLRHNPCVNGYNETEIVD